MSGKHKYKKISSQSKWKKPLSFMEYFRDGNKNRNSIKK
jgi:hypothetical protein